MVHFPIRLVLAVLAAIPAIAAPLPVMRTFSGLSVRQPAPSHSPDALVPRGRKSERLTSDAVDRETVKKQIFDGWIPADEKGMIPSLKGHKNALKVQTEKRRKVKGHSGELGPHKHDLASGDDTDLNTQKDHRRLERARARAYLRQRGMTVEDFCSSKNTGPLYPTLGLGAKASTKKIVAERAAAKLKEQEESPRSEESKGVTGSPAGSQGKGSELAPGLPSTTWTENGTSKACEQCSYARALGCIMSWCSACSN